MMFMQKNWLMLKLNRVHYLNSGDEDTVEEEAEAKGRRVRQGAAQEEGPRRRGQEDIRESSAQGENIDPVLDHGFWYFTRVNCNFQYLTQSYNPTCSSPPS